MRVLAAFAALAVLTLADCGGGSSSAPPALGPASQWVYYNSSGNLTYKPQAQWRALAVRSF